jgi:chaperonin GroES
MLEGRVITGDQREYAVADWDGANRSGWEPLDDKVIVLVDEHVEQTSGGVYVPEHIRQRQTMAAETGTLIALGPGAFVYDDDVRRTWIGRRPEPGDRVVFERYAGTLLDGEDGRQYRLMSQQSIGAVKPTTATV